MPRTLLQLVRLAEHAAGDGLDGRADADAAVNRAGEALCAAHDWHWLTRPSAAVDYVADQSYAALPDDFAMLQHASSEHESVAVVTPGEIAALRKKTLGVSTTASVHAAVVYRPLADGESGTAGAYVLDLYPTPTTNQAEAMVIAYRAGWVTLTDDADVPDLPAWIEPLFERFISAYARGYYDPERLEDLLDRVRASRAFTDAQRRDGGTQANKGPMRGGALDSHWNGNAREAFDLPHPTPRINMEGS